MERNEKNGPSGLVLTAMKDLNLIILLYIALLMWAGVRGMIRQDMALDFLTGISSLPMEEWKIPFLTVLLYGALLLMMEIRSGAGGGLLLKTCMEILVGFWSGYVLGFGYTGIVLLILADALQYVPDSRWKFPFAIGVCLLYLLLDYNLLSAAFHTIPLEAYLEYYRRDVRSVLLGIKNMLVSLNTFLFLVYMILMVRSQMSEKERILSLNEELNEANEKLRQANVQLEEYAREAERMVETRERNRLAREIHDTLGHALTGIITGLEACTVLLDVAPEAAKEQLKAIGEVARQGMTDVRRSVKALRPDMLEKFELKEALESTVREMRQATSAEITYECKTGLNGFDDDEEEIIYRIVQESITNSIRHGKAEKIHIVIDREYNMLRIRIQDNGLGCKEIKKGFGLHHMQERLNMLQGELYCNGDHGFVVEARIPIRWGREEKEND